MAILEGEGYAPTRSGPGPALALSEDPRVAKCLREGRRELDYTFSYRRDG